jgi:hypothetical protein
LTLVSDPAMRGQAESRPKHAVEGLNRRHADVDWSILMAHAQGGDQDAYRCLLHEVAPYIRSLVVKSQRDPADIEDVVQDVLLTVHAVRHT